MPIATNKRETISSNGHIDNEMNHDNDDHQPLPPPPARTIPSETNTDVLIVGAGPIGLLCAYQLVKFSKGKTKVIVIGESPDFSHTSYQLIKPLDLWIVCGPGRQGG